MYRDIGFVASLCLGRIAFGFQFQTLAVLAPDMLARFGLDYAALGTLIGVYMLPGVVMALPGGLLGRRFGARAIVSLGLLLMCAGSLLSVALFTPAGIGAGRAVSGAGAVALVVMQGKMVADRFPGRAFMPVLSLLVGAFPIGVGLAALTRDPVLSTLGPAGLFIVGSAISGAALALYLLSAGTDPASSVRWAFPSRREVILVSIAGLCWTAYNAGYYGFLSYAPSVLTAAGHPAGLIAATMTLSTWLNLPFTLIGGALAARFGATPVFVFGTLTGMLAVAGPAFTDWPLAWSLLFGTAASLHAGVIIAIGTLSARPENRAVGMGLFYTVYYVGGTVFPALCGRAADLSGTPSGALIAAALLAGLALPAYWLHTRMSRQA